MYCIGQTINGFQFSLKAGEHVHTHSHTQAACMISVTYYNAIMWKEPVLKVV